MKKMPNQSSHKRHSHRRDEEDSYGEESYFSSDNQELQQTHKSSKHHYQESEDDASDEEPLEATFLKQKDDRHEVSSTSKFCHTLAPRRQLECFVSWSSLGDTNHGKHACQSRVTTIFTATPCVFLVKSLVRLACD